MTGVTDLLKCPECHRKGTMTLTIRKKTAEADCQACDAFVTERVPYPKHREDDDRYYIPFRIGEVRSFWDDEWDDFHGEDQ